VNWIGTVNPYFNTGTLKGYFDGEPPHGFFEVFAYYLAYDALAALCDTSVGNQGEPEEGCRHMENILCSLDNMNNLVPTWYLGQFTFYVTSPIILAGAIVCLKVAICTNHNRILEDLPQTEMSPNLNIE